MRACQDDGTDRWLACSIFPSPWLSITSRTKEPFETAGQERIPWQPKLAPANNPVRSPDGKTLRFQLRVNGVVASARTAAFVCRSKNPGAGRGRRGPSCRFWTEKSVAAKYAYEPYAAAAQKKLAKQAKAHGINRTMLKEAGIDVIINAHSGPGMEGLTPLPLTEQARRQRFFEMGSIPRRKLK